MIDKRGRKNGANVMPMTGSKGLIGAILTRAIYDACGSKSGWECTMANNPAQKDALAWLHSRARTPFSFLWICDHLGFPPKKILNKTYRLMLTRKTTYFHRDQDMKTDHLIAVY